VNRDIPGTHQKALRVNLDPGKAGTFAEIGAGQEVARWFFRVGGASGTVSKTISAYDMHVSDAIYGPSERYVSRQRLRTMLDYEYKLLLERLHPYRGETTRFFVFADTVAARSFSRPEDGHGWLGIRFQAKPLADASEIIIHMRLWDKENVQQQEALGMLGVNLVYGALYLHHDPDQLIISLADNVTVDRVEVDMVKLTGPAFHGIDNRFMSLKLVQHGLTNAALFTAGGEVVSPVDAFYKKAILVERGSFRPVTRATVDMLECGHRQFTREAKIREDELLTLMEMTLHHLIEGDGIRPRDFLERVDLLGALGKTVLISNFGRYYRLAAYFSRYTRKRVGIVLGVPSLLEIFEEKYYQDLSGGILESFGRMFKNDLKLYVYPWLKPHTEELITASTMRVTPHLRHLHAYLIENRFIEDLTGYDPACLPIFSKDVLEKIQAGDPAWEEMVPAEVARIIKKRHLFGSRGDEERNEKADDEREGFRLENGNEFPTVPHRQST
jgi:hypothetical protein